MNFHLPEIQIRACREVSEHLSSHLCPAKHIMQDHDKIQHQRVIVDTSTKHHGIALWPTPSSDPEDPLRWPRKVKVLALLAVGLFNFTGNFAGAGFSVATPVLEQQFQKTASQINNLLTVRRILLTRLSPA